MQQRHYLRGITLVMLAFFCLLSMDAVAQRTVIIPPNQPGALNTMINGDTTATGARVDSNTVYVLQRGGIYPYTASVENSNYHLTVVASEGDGPRPIVRCLPEPGRQCVRPFNARGSITVKGLYLDGIDTNGSYTDNAPIRMRANGSRGVVEDNVFDNHRLELVRTSASNTSVYFLNNIVVRNYQRDAFWKGWGVSFEGRPSDTLIYKGNTIYSSTHTFWGMNGGPIEYMDVSQNTFVDIALALWEGPQNNEFEYAVVDLGRTKNGKVTDNLFINPAFAGRVDSWGDKLFAITADSVIIQSETEGVPPTYQLPDKLVIKNNYIWFDESLAEAYPDTVSQIEPLGSLLQELQAMNDSRFVIETPIVEDVQLVGPRPDLAQAQEAVNLWWNNDPGSVNIELDDPGFANVNFAYSTSAAAYTGGSAGQPVGDPRWFGLQILTADEREDDLPERFALHGNFPNPFNPSTRISFDLKSAANVSVEVYDLLGRRVLAVPAQQFPVGAEHSIVVDASQLASGTYLYRVSVNDAGRGVQYAMGTMVLIK